MRILIIDDEPAMHDCYRQCFAPPGSSEVATLAAMAADLFGKDQSAGASRDADSTFELTHALQGLDGVAALEKALAKGEPYAIAFIDVRMPPGIDGKQTATRIRQLDPDIDLVIVTDVSDISPIEISRVAGPPDKLFYIAKPFDVAEIIQTAKALGRRRQRDNAPTPQEHKRPRAADSATSQSRSPPSATSDARAETPDRLAFQAALAERARGDSMVGTAILVVDRFKLINDTLGQAAADEVLRLIYQLLVAAKPAGSVVAQLGGNQFGIVFDTTGSDDAAAMCETLLRACSVTLNVFGHSISASASVGVAITAARTASDPAAVIRRADAALKAVKHAGRGLVRVFDDGMDESQLIESGLRRAIAAGEFMLVYQPIIAREALEIVGFEALLRWNSPTYGAIAPGLFLPVAEQSDLIHQLGDWVFDQSLAEVKHWPGQYVSINFSPRQFGRPGFAAYLIKRAQQAGVDPQRIQVEITEAAIGDDADRAVETLDALRHAGFRIALDDFGGGYAALHNIRHFALDCLKIDRSLIDGMRRERESAAIVHSIIHLGRALGLGVIAKGVETDAQVQALRLAGASHLQGFYFSRPVEAAVARSFAAARTIQGGTDPGDSSAIAPPESGTMS